MRERVEDWTRRIAGPLGKRVIELTGDVTPDARSVARADVIITTPEKWDGISRSWQTRKYVKNVALLIIDEIHLLGADRGPILEVIVSRANYIGAHTSQPVRVLGLSTALANAHDLANWLNVDRAGLFNFSSSVRPVPLDYHIRGFEGKHYCPRMASMNKPAFIAIRTYSPDKPVLIFVSSRRQTRLTAMDLMAFCAAEDHSRPFLRMPAEEIERLVEKVVDPNLKLTLTFGIGLHHAGLTESDRVIVEDLFVKMHIQVLVATATLAWGVNYPAHLVIIKGTEYYDGKTKRYVDFPITDVLQMAGRAGRPQFDDKGIAVVFCQDIKKHFYKKFMFEPFPVESSLHEVLPDHLNAEIVGGTINSQQEAMDYLTWTYFFRRLVMNPSYYNLEQVTDDNVREHLLVLVRKALVELEASGCIDFADDGNLLTPLALGRIASYYYLSHFTMRLFSERIQPEMNVVEALRLLSEAREFYELPVRHNEDLMNGDLARTCPLPLEGQPLDSPHTKCFLLLQAHFSRLPLPVADYRTDTKSVLDQCARIVQAMVDVSADAGYLAATLAVMYVAQMTVQGRWVLDNPLLTLPHVLPSHIPMLMRLGVRCIPELFAHEASFAVTLGGKVGWSSGQCADIVDTVRSLPRIDMECNLRRPPSQRNSEEGFYDGKSAGAEGNRKKKLQKSTSRTHQGIKDEGKGFKEGYGGVVEDGDDDVEVGVEDELVMFVKLHARQQPRANAYAPQFPKTVEESWWLVLGDPTHNALLAMKRLGSIRGSQDIALSFLPPEDCDSVCVYLVSSVYLGLDQCVCVKFSTEANDEL